MSADFAAGCDRNGMTLTIEPEISGDVRVDRDDIASIEQIKMRTHRGRWSSGEVAREVLPDLMRGVDLARSDSFRFVTDNPAGLEHLMSFVERRRGETLDASSPLRWRNRRIEPDEFASHLAACAGVADDDPHFARLLDRFSIEIIDPVVVLRDIDRRLAPLVDVGVAVSDVRDAMIAKLLTAASEGRSMSDVVLLGLIGADSRLRLQHVQALPGLLRRKLASDVGKIGYDKAEQARLTPLVATAPMTILSGESGQGKTWSLCQAALDDDARGGLAVLVRAPATFPALVEALNDRIWVPAYGNPAPLQTIARRIRSAFEGSCGHWLTLYLDDLQNRALAREVAEFDWAEIGVRVVVTAQSRIGNMLQQLNGAADVISVADFTSAELRRYLRHHDRDAPFETMPDDVLDLLLKPIHAKIFVALPRREAWVGPTEYELFKGYWTYATGAARDQYDHPHDARRLAALAGSLLGPNPRYPWRASDLERIALDDDAIVRLEVIGLLMRPQNDRVVFTSDRMLNWAVAEYIVGRVVDEGWNASDVDRVLSQVDTIVIQDGIALGQRLGYVMLDTLSLLLSEVAPQFVADVILAEVQRRPQEWRGNSMWSQNLGTLGAGVLPALEILARFPYDEESDWDISRNIPSAIAAIARNDPTEVRGTIARLLSNGGVRQISIALRVARHVPTPDQIDALWAIHIARCRDLAACAAVSAEHERYGELSGRVDVSRAAVAPAIAASSGWFGRRLADSTDHDELNELVWRLADADCVEFSQAVALWAAHCDRFFDLLPNDNKALIHAIEYFGASDRGDWLASVPRMREDWLGARVLKARARLSPALAFQQIAAREEDYGWSSAGWWIEDLVRVDPVALAAAIRANAEKGDHPLTDVILFYGHHPELMDGGTLDWVLDEFTAQLRIFNDCAEPDAELGRLGHVLRFLPTLIEPLQFERLRVRAGTPLETELVRHAAARLGRTTRLYDTEGAQCGRVLAMIGGDGYDALTVAELARVDHYGREDGYRSAHWSDSPTVRDALIASADEPDPDGFRQVLRMQALAINRCDAALEAMVRANAPIYVNAAEMRSADGRPTEPLRIRIEQLISSGRIEDLAVASNLAGFLRDADEATTLMPAFLDTATPDAIRRSMIGTFNALRLYSAELLPGATSLMATGTNDEAQFVASYLAHVGDASARAAVVAWLTDIDLGTWSTACHAYLLPLLEHADSRGAAVAFLVRSRERGHLILDAVYLRALAEAGDQRAQLELVRAAYRSPTGFRTSTVGAIEYLRTVDRDEAFSAARRLLARHGTSAAIDLLLQIDREHAIPILLQRYPEADPSLRWEIARRLRLYCSPDEIVAMLTRLAVADAVRSRVAAAELAGWMPPSIELDWLAAFAEDDDDRLRKAAREALRNRASEAAAMAHMQAIDSSPKPLKWARLMTVVENVDPDFLWARDDPASLGPLIDRLPHEFWIEARDAKSKRRKTLDDEAKKADRRAA